MGGKRTHGRLMVIGYGFNSSYLALPARVGPFLWLLHGSG